MTKTQIVVRIAALVALVVVTGCGDPPDKRLLNLAQQSLAQQARQSEQLAQQSQQVATAARELVAADAHARQELIAGLTKCRIRSRPSGRCSTASATSWSASGERWRPSKAAIRLSPRRSAPSASCWPASCRWF